MPKRFVLDTSVLLYDIDCLFKFEDNEVIIPSVVFEEINQLKEENSERGYYAKRISEIFDELSRTAPLRKGVKLGNTLIRSSYDIQNNNVRKSLTKDRTEYKIISCAVNNNAILISRDPMMRVIARDFVHVEEYRADQIQVQEVYKGYREIYVHPDEIENLYSKRLENKYNLYPNEFAILINEENPEHRGVGICKKDRILPLSFENKKLKLRLTPLNLEQRMFLYLLLDDEITCVTATGPSGKGKSLLAVDYALASVRAKQYNQFLFTKSAIAVDKREELGYYKGDMEEKLKPHLQPLYSSLEYLYQDELYKGKQRHSIDQLVSELLSNDILRFYPLANIRGMSIFNKVVMLDEAQNTTPHMMKSLVTRMNDNAKLIVTGDIDQIDDRNLNKYNNGLTHLIEAGKEEPYIAHICMDITEESRRGKLATFGAKKL